MKRECNPVLQPSVSSSLLLSPYRLCLKSTDQQSLECPFYPIQCPSLSVSFYGVELDQKPSYSRRNMHTQSGSYLCIVEIKCLLYNASLVPTVFQNPNRVEDICFTHFRYILLWMTLTNNFRR